MPSIHPSIQTIRMIAQVKSIMENESWETTTNCFALKQALRSSNLGLCTSSCAHCRAPSALSNEAHRPRAQSELVLCRAHYCDQAVTRQLAPNVTHHRCRWWLCLLYLLWDLFTPEVKGVKAQLQCYHLLEPSSSSLTGVVAAHHHHAQGEVAPLLPQVKEPKVIQNYGWPSWWSGCSTPLHRLRSW